MSFFLLPMDRYIPGNRYSSLRIPDSRSLPEATGSAVVDQLQQGGSYSVFRLGVGKDAVIVIMGDVKDQHLPWHGKYREMIAVAKASDFPGDILFL